MERKVSFPKSIPVSYGTKWRENFKIRGRPGKEKEINAVPLNVTQRMPRKLWLKPNQITRTFWKDWSFQRLLLSTKPELRKWKDDLKKERELKERELNIRDCVGFILIRSHWSRIVSASFEKDQIRVRQFGTHMVNTRLVRNYLRLIKINSGCAQIIENELR